jgi:uncharacterized protein with PIN domain
MSEVKVRGPLPPKSRMADVCFRFYGRLNDFLPAARRGSRFTYRLRHLPSVKDAIESLGVPHPEVDVILVNGSPEDFACRLRDGDDVSVYPAFRSIDMSGLRRAGIDPPSVIRFAVDVHLGKLASLLRLAGFDAVVMPDDSDVAAMASRDARIALTRDVNLLKRRVLRHGYWVRSTDPEWQLTEVLERFDLVSRMEPFARCLRCNVPVVAVDAEAVAARLLPRTRAAFWQFHRCAECDRIYWQGSHYDRLCQLLERARERVVARTNDVRGNAW